jgi:C_GCAxxG_C_C family probable redox protein
VARALRHFRSGYHCSQAILLAYGRELGLDADQALRISAPLAGGSTVGGECGVVVSGYLILGLKYGATAPAFGDVEAEDRLWSRVRRFVGEFRKRHGAIACRELLGVDVFTREGRAQALREDLFVIRCPRYIRDAIDILDSLEAAE